MRGARVAGAAGLATLAGLFLTPGSAWADPGVAPSGAASASSITVSISPQALLVVPTSLLDGLQSQPTLGPLVGALKGAISDGVTISLDNAAVQGTLNHTATDLTTGKATSQAARKMETISCHNPARSRLWSV